MPRGVYDRSQAVSALKRLTNAEVINSRVNKDGPEHPTCGKCWMWLGKLTKTNPYGQFRGKRANRACYEVWVGPIPDGMKVLHKCDNPGCVNPQHLFLGTAKDNMRDKMEKGRWKGGYKITLLRSRKRPIRTWAEM